MKSSRVVVVAMVDWSRSWKLLSADSKLGRFASALERHQP